jgi:hypothetical protein
MIILPDVIWNRLLDEFRWPRKRVERVAYFDGTIMETDSVVTTLAFPDAQLEKTHFAVNSAAMSECGAHFRKYGLARIAQAHTHPGTWVGHSLYDDQMAYSQHIGAVSIVMPEHARKRPLLQDCGVHVRTKAGWVQIPPNEIDSVIRQTPGFLDFRRKR